MLQLSFRQRIAAGLVLRGLRHDSYPIAASWACDGTGLVTYSSTWGDVQVTARARLDPVQVSATVGGTVCRMK
jgi:hypothetical protein